MGACYSKNASESHSPRPGKLPRQKHRDSKRTPRNSEDPVLGTHLLNKREKADGEATHTVKDDSDQCVTGDALSPQESRSSTPDYIPDHIDEKFVDRGVAPSDSGIESIVTIHDEAQDSVQLRSESDNLSKKLERLSRGSCHKCGQFKLDDSALTALLADTYCSCGPRLAGKSSVNPQCQTHGVNRNKRTVSPVEYIKYGSGVECKQNGANCTGAAKGQNENSNGILDKLELKSSLKSSNSAKKDKSLRISLRSANSLGLAMSFLSSPEQSTNELLEDDDNSMAPLAHFDSVDTVLNATPAEKSNKRRSLLSEILDITDSICKCDFYSNEFCWADNHCAGNNTSEAKYYTSDLRFDTDSLHKDSKEKETNGYSTHDSCETSQDISYQQQQNDLNKSGFDSAVNESQRTGSVNQDANSPSKKCASLPKNVSFAAHGCDSQTATTGASSLHGLRSTEGYEYSMSDASSGVFTNNSVSETFLIKKCRDVPKRCASLGSGVVMSDSSSEVADGETNEDLTSLDLDSVSRVTSLSYGSIRQLMESTEDLVAPFETAKRMIMDGVDCMIIPTDVYRQMQADIALLKQQLLFLSTLIEQEAEELEKNCAKEVDCSFASQP